MSTILAEIAQILTFIKPNPQPFHAIPIKDCGEPLVPLASLGDFAYETEHPYLAAEAPYHGRDPFSLRRGNAQKFARAQADLQRIKPGWKLKLFDGYRPVKVQAYMVAFTFYQICKEEGLTPTLLDEAQKNAVMKKVYRIWSPPNEDPLTPPPHSTGGAIDCTLVDEKGHDVDMGSPIDFNGDESNPSFFQDKNPAVHANRTLLRDLMQAQGFIQHDHEWWHYSYGDQYWVWLNRERGHPVSDHAIYGRCD